MRRLLHDYGLSIHSAVPSHLVYWLVVVAGAFGLNLLLLALLAP